MHDARMWAAALAAVLALAFASGAAADTVRITDAPDPDRLDIVGAAHGHLRGRPHVLVHSIRFVELRWDQFIGAGVEIWVPDGDAEFDYHVNVDRASDGSLRAYVTDFESHETRSASARVIGRSIRIQFRRAAIGAGTMRYRWRASVTANPCAGQPDIACVPAVDWAPDERSVLHRLPRAH